MEEKEPDKESDKCERMEMQLEKNLVVSQFVT